jgi:uncharacterized membrane protein
MATLVTGEIQRVPAYPARAVMSALPLICFAGALVTDVLYWRTSEIQWANFSAWLLALGMPLGVLSVVVELIHTYRTPRPLRTASDWWRIGVIVIALAVALANNFVHARDGWTSVVPTGLILSAITLALLLVAAAFMSARFANRDRIGYPL